MSMAAIAVLTVSGWAVPITLRQQRAPRRRHVPTLPITLHNPEQELHCGIVPIPYDAVQY